jgi:hypothetical protein
VVTETDEAGRSESRTLQADAHGGVWIPISASARAISVAVDGKELYRSVAQLGPASSRSAEIASLQPFQGEAPPGFLESGALTELRGTGLRNVSYVESSGSSAPVLASGPNYVLTRLPGEGPVLVHVQSRDGLIGPTRRVTLIQLVPEGRPPEVLRAGQVAEVVLRVRGTDQAIPVLLTSRSQSVRLAEGRPQVRVMSSGGAANLVRAQVTANRAGPYDIEYRVVK